MRNGSANFLMLQNSLNSSPKKITAGYADFADVSLSSHASHSEAATAEESETLQSEAVCFPSLAPQVTGRFARCRPARPVLLARLRNLVAYLLRACLSFHNDPDRKAGRKSLRRSRS